MSLAAAESVTDPVPVVPILVGFWMIALTADRAFSHPVTSNSITTPPVLLLANVAVVAALVGDAPAFTTQTERICVELAAGNRFALRVSLVKLSPCPATPVGSVGDDAKDPTTNATSREFAAGVYVVVVAYVDDAVVE